MALLAAAPTKRQHSKWRWGTWTGKATFSSLFKHMDDPPFQFSAKVAKNEWTSKERSQTTKKSLSSGYILSTYVLTWTPLTEGITSSGFPLSNTFLCCYNIKTEIRIYRNARELFNLLPAAPLTVSQQHQETVKDYSWSFITQETVSFPS